MRTAMKSVVPLLCAAALAGCSGGDADGVRKELDDLRADLARTQKENEKLRSQVQTDDGRINGLAQDLARVRQLNVEVKAAPASDAAAAATNAGDPSSTGASTGAAPGAAASSAAPGSPSSPESVALKNFFASEEGKKVLENAQESFRDQQAREQAKRRVDQMVDRFAKQAQLTDDQTKRMRDILEKQTAATRDVYASLRELDPDATQEQRDELRKQATARTDELKRTTDDQLRVVLSSQQFESWQTEQDKERQRVRGVTGGAKRNNGAKGGAGGNNN